ncbi:MAG: rhodanese-like domain-containing protein [Solirubrobacterales bacterium]
MDADTSSDPATSLAPERVAEMLEAGDAQVIDVRADFEWEAGHVSGARHIQIDAVSGQADTIDRRKPVVFQCRGGSRSEMVASAFRESGWDAYNMEGGLRAWAARGLPLEPDRGRIEEGRGLPGR